MFQLLNRISWCISILIWMVIISLLAWSYFYDWLFLIGIVFWIILKKLLFSENYIQERLKVFANWLEAIISEKNKIHINTSVSLDSLSEIKQEQNNLVTQTIKNNTREESIQKSLNKKPHTETSKFLSALKKIFSENILAKIGAILVFLGIVFLMSLFWHQVPAIIKIMLGFAIGFWIYFIWIKLDKKWFIWESKILLWTWILINFLVILAGKYIIWDNYTDTHINGIAILSTGITFILLILNTIFWLVTSLVYQSRLLLLFSFIFAYINPFLIGWNMENPYTILGYSMIVSLGALFTGVKQKDKLLQISAFIWWNILFLLAPFQTEIWWISILTSNAILWFITLFSFYKNEIAKITAVFIVNYIFMLSILLIGLYHNTITDISIMISIIIISFIYLFISYYLSTKKDCEFLYTIGTIWTILMLFPIIQYDILLSIQQGFDINYETENYISMISPIIIISVIIFALANIILPFVNKHLIKKWANIKNVIIWSISGLLFIWFELFRYGQEYFPGLVLWFAFWLLAILYFILSYLMMNKIWIENIKNEISFRNIIYSYLFISISIFSLAVALVFSNSPEIISSIWLFEATILFYFYNQTKENKIWTLWIILFIIWILQLFNLEANIAQYLFFVPLSLILIAFVLNIKYLDEVKSWAMRVIHDIFHILWIWTIWILLLDIIPNTLHGWNILWISLFISLIWYIYAKFSSNILKVFFILCFSLFTFGHFEEIERVVRKIDRDNLEYLRILQYLAFWIIWITVILWNKININKYYNKFINSIFVLYTLAIVSYFVFDIFASTFAITIFWWITASIILFHGINTDKWKLRTIWLYLFTLVLWKIFIYDIWYLDNAVTRVIALLVIWILLIIISIKYTSKYWNNLKWEFSFTNLSSSNIHIKTVMNNSEQKTIIEELPLVNQHIENINISDIVSVKFYPNKGKVFISKAQNLKKIVKLILEEKPSGNFSANELLDTYNYLIENYKTSLSKRDFNLLNWSIYNFVKNWWKVEIKRVDT